MYAIVSVQCHQTTRRSGRSVGDGSLKASLTRLPYPLSLPPTDGRSSGSSSRAHVCVIEYVFANMPSTVDETIFCQKHQRACSKP
jgi:hypothetical protein